MPRELSDSLKQGHNFERPQNAPGTVHDENVSAENRAKAYTHLKFFTAGWSIALVYIDLALYSLRGSIPMSVHQCVSMGDEVHGCRGIGFALCCDDSSYPDVHFTRKRDG